MQGKLNIILIFLFITGFWLGQFAKSLWIPQTEELGRSLPKTALQSPGANSKTVSPSKAAEPSNTPALPHPSINDSWAEKVILALNTFEIDPRLNEKKQIHSLVFLKKLSQLSSEDFSPEIKKQLAAKLLATLQDPGRHWLIKRQILSTISKLKLLPKNESERNEILSSVDPKAILTASLSEDDLIQMALEETSPDE